MSVPTLAAIIVAAGSSRRMGFDKLTAPLGGKPLVRHSLEAFCRTAEVSRVVLVCSAERIGEFTEIAAGLPKVSRIVAGGVERAHSVLEGVRALVEDRPEFVAVHDGARPLVTPEAISLCFREAIEHGASVSAEPVTDTLHRTDAERFARETVSRENLWRMQTPQVMHTDLLERLLKESISLGGAITDEISLLIRSGGSARIVENPDWNFKVTYPRDLELAELILSKRNA